MGTVQVKREIEKGDGVFLDDISDVHRMDFRGVTIPNDAGFLIIFSVGWRRAIFYDFLPLLSREDQKEEDREYDIGSQLAKYYAYLLFQKRFKITDAAWTNLFDGQWFPFIALKDATIRKLISQASNNWPLDDLVEAIAQETRDVLPRCLERWRSVPVFEAHMPFLERAVDRYLDNDFMSATAILYPRIEGILRSHQKQGDPMSPSTQKGLSGSAVKIAESERHTSTPLLPSKFRAYLESVYFAAFDPNALQIKVSRNSVGHGVATASECSVKSATISLLLVDQLCYCFLGAAPSVAVNYK